MPTLLDYPQQASGFNPTAPAPALVSPNALPGYIVRDDTPLAMPGADEAFSFWLLSRRSNQWVDISAYISGADFQQGGRLPHRIGGVEQPAQGFLYIADEGGAFDTFNPHPTIGQTAGCAVEVHKGPMRGQAATQMFAGYTRGAQAIITPDNETIKAMPLYGVLQRAAEVGQGVFQLQREHIDCATAIRNLLANSDIPLGAMALDVSDVMLVASQLNGITRQGQRGNANLLGALNVIAQAEGGRVYDNRLGQVVFTSRRGYGIARHRATHTIAYEDNQRRDLDPSTTVVNIIQGAAETWSSDGEYNRHTQFVEGRLPSREWIEPRATRDFVLTPTQADGTPFREGYYVRPGAAITRNNGWTGNQAFQVSVLQHPTEQGKLIVRFTNGRDRGLRFQLQYVNFVLYTPVINSYFPAVRSQASISLYGPKSALYPYSLLLDKDSAQARATAWLNKYKGVGDTNEATPLRAMELTIPQWEGALPDIDDIAYVSHETAVSSGFHGWPFWIRGVRHIIDDNDGWDVVLTLEHTGQEPAVRAPGEAVGLIPLLTFNQERALIPVLTYPQAGIDHAPEPPPVEPVPPAPPTFGRTGRVKYRQAVQGGHSRISRWAETGWWDPGDTIPVWRYSGGRFGSWSRWGAGFTLPEPAGDVLTLTEIHDAFQTYLHTFQQSFAGEIPAFARDDGGYMNVINWAHESPPTQQPAHRATPPNGGWLWQLTSDL